MIGMTNASVFPLPVIYKTRKLILDLTETIKINNRSFLMKLAIISR